MAYVFNLSCLGSQVERLLEARSSRPTWIIQPSPKKAPEACFSFHSSYERIGPDAEGELFCPLQVHLHEQLNK
nr:PRED16 protein [Homo sapiens]